MTSATNPAEAGFGPLLFSCLAAVFALFLSSCVSTNVRTFATPEEATAAIVTAAEAGDLEEANRIFDSFARSSVQRDRVYASLFDTAEDRYESGRSGDAASIFAFVSSRYPNAVAARESLVYALFLDRASSGQVSADSTEALANAIDDFRAGSQTPSAWVDLAETQLSIDQGDLGRARTSFDSFLSAWDGSPPELLVYVEDIGRYLQTH
ncbi:MAG: hypothetical protein AAGA20_17770 [Planctomycetota bacterium]